MILVVLILSPLLFYISSLIIFSCNIKIKDENLIIVIPYLLIRDTVDDLNLIFCVQKCHQTDENNLISKTPKHHKY